MGLVPISPNTSPAAFMIDVFDGCSIVLLIVLLLIQLIIPDDRNMGPGEKKEYTMKIKLSATADVPSGFRLVKHFFTGLFRAQADNNHCNA